MIITSNVLLPINPLFQLDNATAITETDIGRNENDSFHYNGHSYYVYSGLADSWEDALSFCDHIGGFMAIIDDKDENEYIYNLVHSLGYDSAYFGFANDAVFFWWRS